MLEGIAWVIIAVIAFDLSKYYKETGDNNIEGFLEYLKNKYSAKTK